MQCDAIKLIHFFFLIGTFWEVSWTIYVYFIYALCSLGRTQTYLVYLDNHSRKKQGITC